MSWFPRFEIGADSGRFRRLEGVPRQPLMRHEVKSLRPPIFQNTRCLVVILGETGIQGTIPPGSLSEKQDQPSESAR
jgi:hypothetical protein